MANRPIPMQKMLQDCHVLRQLERRLDEQQALLEQVRHLLPEYLAPHCQAAIRSGGNLTLYAASPAWASRLRYLSRDLRQSLQGEKPRQVLVRVLGAGVDIPAPPKVSPARLLSAANQTLLRATAESLSDDKLRAALCRLANHGDY